ncbi:hypothetical protein [Streptomyces sp. NPDC059003]|uniref:hypothetical protein n=1 Tax=Streptomyces sp. NPDC059003 TaxID=3346691 RepID=UPI00367D6141
MTATTDSPAPPSPDGRTPDQERVAEALLTCVSGPAAAAQLGMDPTTFRRHVRDLHRRYGVDGAPPLVHALLTDGLRPPAIDSPLPGLDDVQLRLIPAIARWSHPRDIAAAALIPAADTPARIKQLLRTAQASNGADLVRRMHAWGLLGAHRSANTTEAAPQSHADLVVLAERHVRAAAARQWPGHGIRLDLLPALHSVVFLVHLAEHRFVAKYTLAGTCLSTLLHGLHGTRDNIRRQQAAYRQTRRTREFRQERDLQALGQAGIAVTAPAGVVDGVLFTQTPTLTTLSDVLREHPQRAARALTHVADILNATATKRLLPNSRTPAPSPIIQGLRRLQFPAPWAAQLARTDAPQAPAALSADILTTAQGGLLNRLEQLPVAPRPQYGHLQPDHILCPGHPSHTPTLISPALHFGPRGADLARLISRTHLDLLTCPAAAPPVVAALTALVTARSRQVARPDRRAWLTGVLHLWLADTLNALADTLLAHPDMPLPPQSQGITQHFHRAHSLLRVLRRASTMAICDPHKAWNYALQQTAHTIAD